MTTPCRFTREAINELHALQAYLSERSEQAGEQFPLKVQETIDRLCLWPESGHVVELPGVQHLSLRMTTVKGFNNYIIIYNFDGDMLTIEHVFHGAQNWVRFLFAE